MIWRLTETETQTDFRNRSIYCVYILGGGEKRADALHGQLRGGSRLPGPARVQAAAAGAARRRDAASDGAPPLSAADGRHQRQPLRAALPRARPQARHPLRSTTHRPYGRTRAATHGAPGTRLRSVVTYYSENLSLREYRTVMN